MNEQSCPLMMMAGYNAGFNHDTDTNKCAKDKCAWWFGAQGCCSLPTIANFLDRVTGEIQK